MNVLQYKHAVCRDYSRYEHQNNSLKYFVTNMKCNYV